MRRESFALSCCDAGGNAGRLETGERMDAGRHVMDKRGISAGYA